MKNYSNRSGKPVGCGLAIDIKKMIFRKEPRRGNGIEVRMGAHWFDELQFVEVYDI